MKYPWQCWCACLNVSFLFLDDNLATLGLWPRKLSATTDAHRCADAHIGPEIQKIFKIFKLPLLRYLHIGPKCLKMFKNRSHFLLLKFEVFCIFDPM